LGVQATMDFNATGLSSSLIGNSRNFDDATRQQFGGFSSGVNAVATGNTEVLLDLATARVEKNISSNAGVIEGNGPLRAVESATAAKNLADLTGAVGVTTELTQ